MAIYTPAIPTTTRSAGARRPPDRHERIRHGQCCPVPGWFPIGRRAPRQLCATVPAHHVPGARVCHRCAGNGHPAAAGRPECAGAAVAGVRRPARSSLLVSWLADGRAGVRKLLSRVVLWRFSAWRWAIILFAVPVLTVALAAASGTLTSPERGWAAEIGWYLFNTLIFGALTLNLWEETAWAGFAQSRWMARHGLLVGSLITAVFFAAIHVPLQFEGDPSPSRILASTGLVFLTALIARYLIGMHLLDTRGSILAAGVQ